MKNAQILFALASAGLATGCASRTAPTEANFRKVIEPLTRDQFCKPIQTSALMSITPSGAVPDPAFPIVIKATMDNSADSDERGVRSVLEQGAQHGLMTRREQTSPARPKDGSSPLSPVPLIVYEPTAAGRPTFRSVQAKTAGGNMRAFPNFCMGTGKVDAILSWTDPADAFGRTITQVSYRYSATDFPSFMPADFREQLTAPKEAKVTLMRTNAGWQIAE